MNINIVSLILKNWKSGLTVALVSIPLSVSLAIASQTTPSAGIITAIWAGLIAAVLGGSNYNVIGPTGALSGLLATYALRHGAVALSTLALVVGVLIILAYLLKLERYLVFIPASTIHGFTLGVACIIAFNQLNFIFGLSEMPMHKKFVYNVLESFKHIPDASGAASSVFFCFFVLLFILLKFLPQVPGIILLTPVGIVLGYLAHQHKLSFNVMTLKDKFGEISSTPIQMQPLFWDNSLLITGITVALIAILETLISAKIADGLTRTKHDRRKEVMALGVANIVSGLTGGIPATAALARTALNIKSGATHKISGMISSVCIILISLLFLGYVMYLPLPVIAAFLVFVAIRMIEREHFARLFKSDKKGFFVSLLVALVCIVEDPIMGILLGTAVSLILFMEELSHGYYEVSVHQRQRIAEQPEEQRLANVLVYSIKGELAYINSQAHITRFEQYHDHYGAVIIRLNGIVFIDSDGVEALDEIITLLRESGMEVVIAEVPPIVDVMLRQSSDQYRYLIEQGLVATTVQQAMNTLGIKTSSNI